MDAIFNPATLWAVGIPVVLIINILLIRHGTHWVLVLEAVSVMLWGFWKWEQSLPKEPERHEVPHN